MWTIQNIKFSSASVDLHYRTALEILKTTPRKRLVLFCHGGGWEGLDEDVAPSMLMFRDSLLAAGFIVGSVAYRLDGWPNQMHDLRTCIRFLRANAEQYLIDPGRIGLCGMSAGAHMIALHGMAGECAAFDGEGWNDQPSAVKAICALSGPHDLAEYFRPAMWDAFSPSLKDRAAQLAKDVFPSQCPEYLWLNSARAYRGGKDTAWMIAHGTQDDVCPFSQGLEMYAWLNQLGRDVAGLPVEGANHAFDNCDRVALTRAVTEFFVKKL